VNIPKFFVWKTALVRTSILLSCAAILGLTALQVNAQNRYWLKIVNHVRVPITQLFVASTEDGEWGPDQFGDKKGDVLDPGETYTLDELVAGEYNIKFVNPDGDTCVLKDIKIFKNESWILTSAWLEKCSDRTDGTGSDNAPAKEAHRYTLTITNKSIYGIYKMFVMSTEDNVWGPDQLGEGKSDVLHPGEFYTLTDLSAGEYNIRFVNKAGDTCTLKNVKIMKNESWLLTTAWLDKCQ